MLDWAVANEWLQHHSLSLSQPSHPELHPGAGQRYFLKFPLLQTVQVIPAAAIFQAWATPQDTIANWNLLAMFVSIPAACIAGWGTVGLTLFLERLGHTRQQSIRCSLLALLTSPWWVYSRYYYGENLQIGVGCWLLWAWLKSRQTQPGRSVFWLGLLAGASLNCKLTFVCWMIVMLLDQISIGRKFGDLSSRLSSGLLGLTPGLFCLFGYNLYRYGDPLKFGYDVGRDAALGFSTPFWVGLHGLLLSSGKSIFLYAPGLLLLASCFPLWKKSHPQVSYRLIMMASLQLLMISCWWCWSGDWAWGPRLVLTFIPPLLGWIYASRQKMPIVLISLGLAINLLGVVIHPGKFISTVMPQNQAMFQDPATTPDDSLLLHYLPDYSPVAGHLWLLATYTGMPANSTYPWQFRKAAHWQPAPVPKFYLDTWWRLEPAPIVTLCILLVALVAITRKLRSPDSGVCTPKA